jgi:hypothetical protein
MRDLEPLLTKGSAATAGEMVTGAGGDAAVEAGGGGGGAPVARALGASGFAAVGALAIWVEDAGVSAFTRAFASGA